MIPEPNQNQEQKCPLREKRKLKGYPIHVFSNLQNAPESISLILVPPTPF